MNEYLSKIELYNFWTGKKPEIGISRTFYTEKIADYFDVKLVKVLVGQRRVGKSYILRQLATMLTDRGVAPQNIFYVNKEFTDYDFLKTYKDLENLVEAYIDHLKPEGKKYLFIDEIQNIEGWERAVNSYSQTFADDFELFITGSNSELLSGELASLLSGRYVSFEIFPFCFAEHLDITNQNKSKTAYIQYMESGGLPEMYNLPNYESKRNYVSAVRDTVLLRDVIQRHAIKDPRLLEDLFVFLVSNASNLVSITNIVDYFSSKKRKTSYETIANYIGYIEQAFLTHKAERYNVRGKETIVGNAKYYTNDLSFINFLYAGNQYGTGYKLENLIYLELKRNGFYVNVGIFKEKEIDFVARKNDRIIYIQSCYLIADENVEHREYAVLESINDNYEKYVVSLDDVQFPSKKGIKHIQAWNLTNIL